MIYKYIRKFFPFLSSISDQNFSNISWLLFDRLVRMGAALFVTLLVARYLGPEDFGKLGFALSLTGIIGILSSLGFETVLVKKILQTAEDKGHTLLGSALVLRLIGAFVSCFFIFLYSYLAIDENNVSLYYVIFFYSCALFFQSWEVIKAFFESKVQSKYIVLATNCSFLIASLLKLLFIYLKCNVVFFALAFLLENIFSAICLYYVYKKKASSSLPLFSFSFLQAKELLKESWLLAISNLAILLYFKLDIIMLGKMTGLKEVGIYNAATRLSEVWYFIPGIFTSTFFPRLFNLSAHDIKLFEDKLVHLLRILIYMAFLLSIIVTFISPWLILNLFGEAFEQSAQILSVHIWTAIFVFMGIGGAQWFLIHNLNKLLFYRTLWGVLVNILLNFLLIPKWGGLGAAYATLAGQIVASFIADSFYSRTRPLFKMKLKAFCWK